MKHTLFAKINTLVFSALAVCTLALGSAWPTPALPALAAAGTPPAKNPAANERLQKAFQQEQAWLSTQSDNLAKANDVAAKVQAWIDAQNSKGLETGGVPAALATFKSQIATAQSSHDTAAGILSNHAGFDGSGQVTDAAQARQTVISARQALNDGHTLLMQAGKDLRAAREAFRNTVGERDRLAREQKSLAQQQTNLDKANGIVTKVQTFIANQKAKGQDTSALEAALTIYQQQLATAQASHTTAANLLNTHAGFDNSGNVTDPVAAHQTLVDAHQALTDAHNVLKQAGQDLQKALQEYRATHHVTSAPKPTAAPAA